MASVHRFLEDPFVPLTAKADIPDIISLMSGGTKFPRY